MAYAQVTAAAAAPAKEPERAEALSSVVLTVVQGQSHTTRPCGPAAKTLCRQKGARQENK